MINLTVKTLDSQNHAFSLEDDQITVRRFKEHIAESVAVPADSQRLIYCGRVLQDDKKLNDYDVNGKVIHLVQSAPPQPGQRNNDSGQSQGQQNQGWQNQQRPHYRFSHAQMHGNAMYLGAMAVPAEIVEGHGLPVPQLSNSLSNSRLIVAKRMLNRANELMDRLDDPSAPLHPSTSENNQSPLPQQIQVQEIETDQEDIFRTGEGRQSTGTRLSEAVAAALGVAISASGASNVTLLRGSNDDGNEGRTTSEAQEDAEMESSAQSQSDQQGTSNANGQNSRRPPTQLPRPPQMGYLLDRLLSTQDRLRPYIERYRVLMLADPSLPPGPGTPEVVEETQRMVDGVSECLHYMSHSCHALSDIIVDMRQQPPRNLRCRPIIIQHSAILQAGVPIQVEAHISLHGRNANNNNGNEETTESTNAQQPSDIVVASGSIEVTTEDNNQPQESSSTPPSQSPEQQRPQEPPQSQFVFDLPNNVEVLMEVSPDSNMEASTGNEPNQSGENNNNNNAGRSSGNTAGIFPWGSAPTPDFLRNLMQAVAGHMAQGGIATVPLTTRTTATTSGGTQQTVAATMDSTSTNAAQSTQARSNVGTHPTTATQTRSTSRPHVFHQHHAHPLGVGMSMGQGLEFDPFLPCNSHHVRRIPTSTPNVTVNSQSTRASQTPAQETQPQAQTASTSTASSTASSTSTASATSSQNAAINPIINFLRQMVGGGTSGQQQTNINVNSSNSDPDLAESFGNMMQMLGNRNIHIGIMGDGGGTNLVSGNVTLANLLQINDTQSRENITEENLLSELALIFVRYMTAEDIVRLRFGISEPIARLRVPLRFLCCVIMNNSSAPGERDQVVERLILHYRPHLQQLLERTEDATGRSGSSVDLCATIESLLSRHCKEILRLVFDTNIDDRRFGQEILTIVKTMGRQLCAVLRYSLRGGQAGLESIAGRVMYNIVNGTNPTIRQWMLNSFNVQFRTFTLRIPQLPDSEILPLLVYKDTTAQTTSASTTVSHESTCSTQEQSQQQQQQQQQQQSQPQSQPQPQQQQSQHEPMETENVEEKSNNEASVPDDGEDIPETFPGHESLPSEWIPIIARDGVRQRRQLQMQGMANGAVTTFSDAYIGGLPTKRRKLIEQQKPRLLVSPTPNHSAITASVERLVREGVSRAGIEEVEGAAVAVATDPGVRHAFGQAIRDCLNPHRYGTPDFPDPLRFPNATKYFSDQERSSK